MIPWPRRSVTDHHALGARVSADRVAWEPARAPRGGWARRAPDEPDRQPAGRRLPGVWGRPQPRRNRPHLPPAQRRRVRETARLSPARRWMSRPRPPHWEADRRDRRGHGHGDAEWTNRERAAGPEQPTARGRPPG